MTVSGACVENALSVTSPLMLAGHPVTLVHLSRIQAHGNKFYKMKHRLLAARRAGVNTLMSFGGAWSNHIHALAAMGREQGFNTVGIIRGERPVQLSVTLMEAEANGMRLVFVSRTDYRRRAERDFLEGFQALYPGAWIIPEGGTGELAMLGAAEIVTDIAAHVPGFDLLVLPVGTGGTLAGIATALAPDQAVLGISVLKGAEYLDQSVAALLDAQRPGQVFTNWQIIHHAHCGGYARCPQYLQDFLLSGAMRGLQLDPVYSGKMLYGLEQWLLQAGLPASTRIVALHTGGEQGRRGFSFLTSQQDKNIFQ